MSYPVGFEMDYIQRRSRVTTFFRYILAIPQFIFAFCYSIAFYVVLIVSWFVLLFTARWPIGLYEFSGGFLRYLARLSAYVFLGVDRYPPFNGTEDLSYPVRIEIAPPLEHYSRLKVLFRPIYAILAIIIRYALGHRALSGGVLLVVRDRGHRSPARGVAERAELLTRLHDAGGRAAVSDHRDLPATRRAGSDTADDQLVVDGACRWS